MPQIYVSLRYVFPRFATRRLASTYSSAYHTVAWMQVPLLSTSLPLQCVVMQLPVNNPSLLPPHRPCCMQDTTYSHATFKALIAAAVSPSSRLSLLQRRPLWSATQASALRAPETSAKLEMTPCKCALLRVHAGVSTLTARAFRWDSVNDMAADNFQEF